MKKSKCFQIIITLTLALLFRKNFMLCAVVEWKMVTLYEYICRCMTPYSVVYTL